MNDVKQIVPDAEWRVLAINRKKQRMFVSMVFKADNYERKKEEEYYF